MRLDNSDEDNFAELINISSDDELDTDIDAIESDDEAEFDSNNVAAGLLDELETVPPQELSYSVFTESDIRRHIDDNINQLSAISIGTRARSRTRDESEIRRQVGLPVATQQLRPMRPPILPLVLAELHRGKRQRRAQLPEIEMPRTFLQSPRWRRSDQQNRGQKEF
ncbi:unnamed protein product [Linum trigynum]|uniref:Uncharacterized protein n=1 Tax=Linum trigynum TaxID=586398 RepID=A0AAV2FV37_9ROSI